MALNPVPMNRYPLVPGPAQVLGLMRLRPGFMLFAILLAFFSGCEITGPAVVPNRSVNQLAAVDTVIGNFHTNEHVAGYLRLTFPENLQTFPIRSVRFFVDSLSVAEISNYPYTVSIDTRSFAEGQHLVSAAAYEVTPTLGMYNLLGMPRIVCGAPVVFDQTPPLKVTGLRVTYDGSTVIQWDQTASLSFRSYIVGVSLSSTYLLNTLNYRDTITDRTTTSWRINSSSVPPGAEVGVSITVDNGAQLGPFAAVTGVVGNPIPIASPVLSFWNHPARSETYAWTQEGRMVVLGARGDSVLRSSGILGSGTAIFSQDGSRFYIYSPTAQTISGFLVDDLSPIIPVLALPVAVSAYTSAVLSPNGRFYIGNYDGTVWAIDQLTGALVGSTVLPYNSWDAPRMTATRDSAWLFCTDKGNGICKIDIRHPVPAVVLRNDVSSHIYDLRLSPDEQTLIVTHFDGASVYLVNPADLSPAADLPLPGPPCYREYYGLDSYSKAFVCSGTSLFVASQFRYVSQFDLTSHALVARWCTINDPGCMGISRDGRSILLGSLGQVPSPNLLLAK